MGKKVGRVIAYIIFSPVILAMCLFVAAVYVALFAVIPVIVSAIISAIVTHGFPPVGYWKVVGIILLAALVVVGIVLFIQFIISTLAKSHALGAESQNAGDIFKESAKNIFSGLSPAAARKKYVHMMKENHPDNGGSEEAAKSITRDYEEYKQKTDTH